MKIIIRRRELYGNVVYYPVNDSAMAVVFMTGRKTISRSDIDKLKQLGHTIELVTEAL